MQDPSIWAQPTPCGSNYTGGQAAPGGPALEEQEQLPASQFDEQLFTTKNPDTLAMPIGDHLNWALSSQWTPGIILQGCSPQGAPSHDTQLFGSQQLPAHNKCTPTAPLFHPATPRTGSAPTPQGFLRSILPLHNPQSDPPQGYCSLQDLLIRDSPKDPTRLISPFHRTQDSGVTVTGGSSTKACHPVAPPLTPPQDSPEPTSSFGNPSNSGVTATSESSMGPVSQGSSVQASCSLPGPLLLTPPQDFAVPIPPLQNSYEFPGGPSSHAPPQNLRLQACGLSPPVQILPSQNFNPQDFLSQEFLPRDVEHPATFTCLSAVLSLSQTAAPGSGVGSTSLIIHNIKFAKHIQLFTCPPKKVPEVKAPPKPPARSRTGCWECRDRKLKCDENHPICAACAKHHTKCFYKQRLTYKSVTESTDAFLRNTDIRGTSWDVKNWEFRGNSWKLGSDQKPPSEHRFAGYTHDEQREKVASINKPGSLFVISTPSTFKETASKATAPGSSYVAVEPTFPSFHPDDLYESEDEGKDQKNKNGGDKREGHEHKNEHEGKDKCSTLQKRLNLSRENPPVAVFLRGLDGGARSSSGSSDLPMLFNQLLVDFELPPSYVNDPKNSMAKKYWSLWKGNSLVSKFGSINPQGNSSRLRIDIEKRIGNPFDNCPLFNVIMTFSSMSVWATPLRQGDDTLPENNKDVYRYYTKATSLCAVEPTAGQEGIVLDRTILSNMLMMIFELNAHGGTLASSYANRLVKIITEVSVSDQIHRYPELVWQAAVCDTYALLGLNSDGTLAETLFKKGLIPDADLLMGSLPHEGGKANFYWYRATLRTAFECHQRLLHIAGTIGRSANCLTEIHASIKTCEEKERFMGFAEKKTLMLIMALNKFWSFQVPPWLKYGHDGQFAEKAVPGVGKLSEQVTSLYATCVMYCFSSMYPEQNVTEAEELDDMGHMIEGIQTMALNIIRENQGPVSGHILFPLFLAGAICWAKCSREVSIQLLDALQNSFLGNGISQLCLILEELNCPHPAGAKDWKSAVLEKELRCITYGFQGDTFNF